MAVRRRNARNSSPPHVAVVGAGNLARALAVALSNAGYAIDVVPSRNHRASQRHAEILAQQVHSRAEAIHKTGITTDIVWLCVPDAAIAAVAQSLARSGDWKGKIALHSSGALTSRELASLRRQGAAVASVHPLMTFVKGSEASLSEVPFAIEGDATAVRHARVIVNRLGGHPFSIRKQDKVAYHAWGTFASPLLTALLATTEHVAAAAGVSAAAARKRIQPILRQTIANYLAMGAGGAFSGPIVRGDVKVVEQHLRILRSVPQAREVYVALAHAAMQYLPGKKREEMKKHLNGNIRR
ncbi:MAG TPA: DUF2520 domain-containing protein [Candidatus Sulfotelmatobacter sp.]